MEVLGTQRRVGEEVETRGQVALGKWKEARSQMRDESYTDVMT